jgi:hypothetical protein
MKSSCLGLVLGGIILLLADAVFFTKHFQETSMNSFRMVFFLFGDGLLFWIAGGIFIYSGKRSINRSVIATLIIWVNSFFLWYIFEIKSFLEPQWIWICSSVSAIALLNVVIMVVLLVRLTTQKDKEPHKENFPR